jgi:Uma2 family endonuclease
MRTGAASIAETAFVSTETFNQKTFKRWVENRAVTDVNRYELTDGRIVITPPAGWGHGEIEARVIRLLLDFVERQNLGRVFGSSTGYDLSSGDTLEPDASFISRDRWTKGPQVRRTQFLKIVPNLVIEILSRATAEHGRIEKKTIYEVNGVEEYWLVDPDRRMVTVFHLVGGGYSTGKNFAARQKLGSRVLPGFKVPARLFFP